jgi:sugar phosphate isomerase/epimerase
MYSEHRQKRSEKRPSRIQEKANIGIVTFMAYPIGSGTGPVEKSIGDLAADDYFQVMEITCIVEDASRHKCQAILRQNKKIPMFGSHPAILTNKLNLNHPDASQRKQAVEVIKKHIDEAYTWKAAGLVVLSGPDPGEDSREKAKGLLVDSLKQLCEYSASKGGMPITLEVFDRASFAKNCLIGPSEEAAQVAEEVRKSYPGFGILPDLSHIPLLNESPAQCLGVLKEYVTHAHIGNCVMRNKQHPAYGDNHPRFGIADGENGVDELTEFLRALKKIGFFDSPKKPLSFELKPAADEIPGEVIKEAQEFLDKAWAGV